MWGRRIQQGIYLKRFLREKPPVPVHPEALERAAKGQMSPEAFAYVAGGAGVEATMARNRQAFLQLALHPRMLRGAKPPSLETHLFGRGWAAPLFLAPIGVLELAHPLAELAAVRAAARRGLPFMVSNQSSYPLEAVVEAAKAVNPEAPVFFQLYHSSDGRVVESFLKRAERAGCAGVVKAVGGRVPVLLDSGVRSGADVVKALALGAQAVGLGRPYVYGLALRGEEGVGAVLDHFLAELELTLALSGVARLEEVGPHLLFPQGPP